MAVYRIPTMPIVSKSVFDINSECWKQSELEVNKIRKYHGNGKGALMAVLDDGVSRNTELAKSNIEQYTYFEKGGWFGDHSTQIASIVIGNTLGIFPDLKIVSKKVLDDQGLGGSREIVSAIYKAKEMGIRVISLSIGSNDSDPLIEKALAAFVSDGVSFAIIASGNDGNTKGMTTDYPARYASKYAGIYSIAATQIEKDGTINIASFSSKGIVTISAPGVNLKAMNKDSIYDFVSGTSFSCPIVASAISVAISLNPILNQFSIYEILSSTSDKMKAPFTDAGHGKINIYEFLNKCKNVKEIKKQQTNKTVWQKACEFFK